MTGSTTLTVAKNIFDVLLELYVHDVNHKLLLFHKSATFIWNVYLKLRWAKVTYRHNKIIILFSVKVIINLNRIIYVYGMRSMSDKVVFHAFEIISNETNVEPCLQTNSNTSLVKHVLQMLPTRNIWLIH